MKMEMQMEMTLVDALEIVKEVADETISKENVTVEDVEQEREAIDLVNRFIELLNQNESLRFELGRLIEKWL